jgi:hypothetical protein
MVIEHVIVALLAFIVVILWRYRSKKRTDVIGKLVMVVEPDGDINVFLRVPQDKLDSCLKDGEVVSFLVAKEDYDEFIASQE